MTTTRESTFWPLKGYWAVGGVVTYPTGWKYYLERMGKGRQDAVFELFESLTRCGIHEVVEDPKVRAA